MEYNSSQENSKTQKVTNPVIPRVCSIKEALRRSITIDQFFGKLHDMVDEFYNAKA